MDFESDDVMAVLRTHGFQADAPCLFVWEAVTQYLTEAGVRRSLGALYYTRRYLEPCGRRLAVTDLERFVSAEKVQ